MPAQFWPFNFWKRSWWQQWFRVSTSHQNLTTLSPRLIYIIPTRWGLMYAVTVFLLLLGSINYTLSLGYYVTFLLSSLGVVAMLQTWLNFAHLQIEVIGAKPVFAGEAAQVQLKLTDHKNRARFNINTHFDNNELIDTDLASNQTLSYIATLQTSARGWLNMPKLVLHTEFPLGLFYAWAVIRHPQPILVYAKPSEHHLLNSNTLTVGNDSPHPNQRGDDDFNGHKTYQQGDAPSRLDWKASSRGLGLLSKVYSGNVQTAVWLNWADTSGLDVEARISLLTKAVIEAHAAHLNYGLTLPNETFSPSRGEQHYHTCLKALALLT
jgi:uncharacterized protein (DUF58 family)